MKCIMILGRTPIAFLPYLGGILPAELHVQHSGHVTCEHIVAGLLILLK